MFQIPEQRYAAYYSGLAKFEDALVDPRRHPPIVGDAVRPGAAAFRNVRHAFSAERMR
jgi:hypothetical protein